MCLVRVTLSLKPVHEEQTSERPRKDHHLLQAGSILQDQEEHQQSFAVQNSSLQVGFSEHLVLANLAFQ